MFNDKEKAILLLDSFDFATYKKKQKTIELFKNIEKLLDFNQIMFNKQQLLQVYTEQEYVELLDGAKDNKIARLEQTLKNLAIDVVTIFSNNYPENLKHIDTPPFVLYYKGNLNIVNEDCFAIVGSRHISNYGKQITEMFARDLSAEGFCIVSGLASGVDTLAHTIALENNAKTIAVLAGGLDEIYPSTNTNLAKRIVESAGLLISEVRPFRRPEGYMFPIRNRIIAGLSCGILVTEAQEKSGAIHTKNYALEYGKEVFAVPGNIYSLTSKGSNNMIANGGAKAVCNIQDIIVSFGRVAGAKNKKVKAVNYSMEESLVISCLQTSSKSFQEIVDATNLEVKRLNTLLTTLMIRGIIKKLAGNTYYLIE